MLLFTGKDTSKGCLSTTKWLDEYHPIYLWSISMLCNPIKRKSVIIRMKAMHIPKYLTTSPKILYLCSCYVKLSRSHCHCLDILADYLVQRQLYLIFSIWMNVHIPYINVLSYPRCLSQHNPLKTYKELFCTFIILHNTVGGKGSILLPKAYHSWLMTPRSINFAICHPTYQKLSWQNFRVICSRFGLDSGSVLLICKTGAMSSRMW